MQPHVDRERYKHLNKIRTARTSLNESSGTFTELVQELRKNGKLKPQKCSSTFSKIFKKKVLRNSENLLTI